MQIGYEIQMKMNLLVEENYGPDDRLVSFFQGEELTWAMYCDDMVHLTLNPNFTLSGHEVEFKSLPLCVEQWNKGRFLILNAFKEWLIKNETKATLLYSNGKDKIYQYVIKPGLIQMDNKEPLYMEAKYKIVINRWVVPDFEWRCTPQITTSFLQTRQLSSYLQTVSKTIPNVLFKENKNGSMTICSNAALEEFRSIFHVKDVSVYLFLQIELLRLLLIEQWITAFAPHNTGKYRFSVMPRKSIRSMFGAMEKSLYIPIDKILVKTSLSEKRCEAAYWIQTYIDKTTRDDHLTNMPLPTVPYGSPNTVKSDSFIMIDHTASSDNILNIGIKNAFDSLDSVLGWLASSYFYYIQSAINNTNDEGCVTALQTAYNMALKLTDNEKNNHEYNLLALNDFFSPPPYNGALSHIGRDPRFIDTPGYIFEWRGCRYTYQCQNNSLWPDLDEKLFDWLLEKNLEMAK